MTKNVTKLNWMVKVLVPPSSNDMKCVTEPGNGSRNDVMCLFLNFEWHIFIAALRSIKHETTVDIKR